MSRGLGASTPRARLSCEHRNTVANFSQARYTHAMADPQDIQLRRVLNNLGKNLSRARQAERETLEEIADAARESLKAGLSKAEILERAQISRPTLDRLLSGKR